MKKLLDRLEGRVHKISWSEINTDIQRNMDARRNAKENHQEVIKQGNDESLSC